MKMNSKCIMVLAIVCTACVITYYCCRLRNSTQPGKDVAIFPVPIKQPDVSLAPITQTSPMQPYSVPAVANVNLADFVNRNALVERVPLDFSERVAKVIHPVDVQAVVAVLKDSEDNDTVRHEAAELLRRSGYQGLTDDLLAILNNPMEKERFRSWAVQHLGVCLESDNDEKSLRIITKLRQCLNDRHNAVRREALVSLSRFNDPVAKETAVKWLLNGSDDYDAVRPQAIRVVRELNAQEYLPQIRALVRHKDSTVAQFAIATLGDWRDQDSRELLESMLHVSDYTIRTAVQHAIRQLAANNTSRTASRRQPPAGELKREINF